MECDSGMSHVDQRARVELPKEWFEVFRDSTKTPSPMNVIQPDKTDFIQFTSGLKPHFRATCPFQTRPIRDAKIEFEKPGLIFYRKNYHGAYKSSPVLKRARKCVKNTTPKNFAFKKSYSGPLKISKAKFQDLQVLKKFCRNQCHEFYDALPFDNKLSDPIVEEESCSDEENDS